MREKIALTIIFFALFTFGFAQEKPSLSEKDLEKNIYYFEVSDGKLTGDGAKFLIDELSKHQFVLLGEYHGSHQISKFTSAIIPVLHDAGFRNFGLEIGPVSVDILHELSKDSAKTVENLNAFNSKFYVSTKNRTFTPIPFFSYVEDAEFLAETSKRKWNLIGLDQEFSFSYLPLLERMYKNLKPKQQKELKDIYEKAVATVKNAYVTDENGGKSSYLAISESAEYNRFLDSAAEGNSSNKKIADALRKTTDIYTKNILRRYFEANSNRVEYMKKNLMQGFSEVKFDLRKDKMLLKMGGVHTGKGFSPLSLFEIGNTLNELAEFHGNKSLHINFGSRFYIENGKEIDALADKNGFLYRFQALLQMSKKDKWTLIDLRPLRSDVFYARKFKMDEIIWDIFRNHDFYLIAPTDIDPKPNFQTTKQ